MIVRYLNSKLVVEQKNVMLKNYPLDWIEGLEKFSVNDISHKLFGIPYDELNEWQFITPDTSRSITNKRTFKTRTIFYKRRSYIWNHVTENGVIANKVGKHSRFWRGIYFPDLGINGRLGGAKNNKPGTGKHPNFLKYHTSSGDVKTDVSSTDMTSSLIEAAINLIYHFTLEVPPTNITLDHLQQNGLKLVYNLGGPRGGQPLTHSIFGIGETSEQGSTWFNYPKLYVNNYHAPGESFNLLKEISVADTHPTVIAILQQDEPVYTEIFKERFDLIKTLTRKPVFCTYNWGDFYNSPSLRYKMFRSKRIRPIAHVTDIYSNDLYIYTPNKKSFKNFGDPQSNIWRLVDRHRVEISELEKELGSFMKPVWMTVQGYGFATESKPEIPLVPDPDFMFAQIWGAVCLGATAVATYLMHTASSDVTNLNRRAKDKNAPLVHGISPIGPGKDSWYAMAKAYKLIEQYENILLTETIFVSVCEDGHVVTLLKEVHEKYYIFALNCFRDNYEILFSFDVLPGNRWQWKNLQDNKLSSVAFIQSTGSEKMRFSAFELKIIEVQSVPG